MLQCPYCAYNCATKQQLSAHMKKTTNHQQFWKGSINTSIPEGFDIGTPDPEAVARLRVIATNANKARAARRREKPMRTEAEKKRAQRERQNSWYNSLTPKQKKERSRRMMEARRLKKGGSSGCPYCDYSTSARGGITRHVAKEHPGKTGLVMIPRAASEFRDNHAPNLTDKIFELVADKIAAQILERIKLTMKKKTPHLALRIVREYFPGVTTVSDATKPVIIEVTQRDSENSEALNHTACAYAVACKRQMKADGVIIGTKTAYIISGKRAVRYRMPESVAREIVSFDRRAGFAVGTYQLRAPSEWEQLGAVNTGKTHNPSDRKIKRFRHITSNIRTTLGRHVLILAAALALAVSAHAIIVPVDLGPPRTVSGDIFLNIPALGGTPFSGQTLSIDYEFNHLIKLGPSPRFYFAVRAETNMESAGFGLVGSATSTGYVLFRDGELSPPVCFTNTMIFESNTSEILFGLAYPFGVAGFGQPVAHERYLTGLHFDMALPDIPGAEITSLRMHIDPFTPPPYRASRWTVTDTVPETGDTAALLGLGLLALVGYRYHKGS